MTADPGHVGANVGDPQSWNAYVYARNDPVNSVDPTGLETECYVDGLQRDCGDALRLVDIGAADFCPDNVCSGWDWNANAFKFFFAAAGGASGYVEFQDLAYLYESQGALFAQRGGGGGAQGAAAAPVDIVRNNVGLQRDAFCLWKAGGYGSDRREHAAWIVGGAAGPSTVRWPWNATNDRATWNGPTPAGAIAIMHTHPGRGSEKPSVGDFDNSKKDGFPRYVVTREGIWKTTNDYFKPMEVLSQNWWRPFEREAC
jgi:hypothetical protein